MTTDARFPELVSLACHDIRTPLATVSGFAGTLLRMGSLEPQLERYVGLIQTAAGQIAELTDQLSVAARAARGPLDASPTEHDSLELAREAAARVGEERAAASGTGAAVLVDRELVVRGLASLTLAAVRHGGLERAELSVAGSDVELTPVTEAAPVVLSEELRDLGAASARAVIEALGGSLERRAHSVVVRLPAA
ncbi:MAG: hypothetical protein ICV59_02685 [Thermoleophilia bacterium]|nr:hypothetical protein [Thermoleophilia bacterium]